MRIERATWIFRALAVAALIGATLFSPSEARAQETNHESDPATALAAAISAACRADQNQFANYLTADNASAFRALPEEQRTAFLKRFSLAEGMGRPLLSSNGNHPVLRCEATEATVEFHFGDVRTRENLAFVSVSVVNGQQTEFGLVRESGVWRLLSVGLVLLDVPQLSQEWRQSEAAAHDDAVPETLRNIAGAVETYRRAFTRMPASLAQMGPGAQNQVSSDQAALIDEGLAAGAENGYQFRYYIVAGASSVNGAAAGDPKFEISAMPQTYGKSGRRSFLLDASGTIHAADHGGAAATADDPAIENESSSSEAHR